jgi:hypothetical protein
MQRFRHRERDDVKGDLMFYATRPGTKEREAEERFALERKLRLRECKPIEAFAHASIRVQGSGEPTPPCQKETTER